MGGHLNFIESTYSSFPLNALGILLTISVSTARAERSFSKLKTFKNYLRTKMVQDRLSRLSLLSIEHVLCKSLEYDDIFDISTEL